MKSAMQQSNNPNFQISSSRRLWVLSGLLLSSVMASLDSSFVPIAFSDLIDDLDTSTSEVVWVALGYLIAATGPMLFMARVADRIGRAKMFGIGTLVYAVAMSACSYADSVSMLIMFRIIQGFGMAMFLPTTFTLATEVYPPEERGKALGIMASGNAFGFLLGPIFAGWLLDAYDWHALFLSRIPLGLIAIILGFTVFGKNIGRTKTERSHYDIVGATLLTFSLFGLLYGFNRLPVEDNHLDFMTWAIFLGGVILFPIFIKHEQRSPDPIIDINLFKNNKKFTRAGMAYSVMFASFPAELFVLPMLLIVGLEIRSWDVGLLMAVGAVVTFFISPKAGKLADKFGAERLCTIGTILAIIGYGLMMAVPLNGSIRILYLAMAVFGIGTGLFFSPNNSIIMSSVPPERTSMASGLIGTFRQTGYAVGFAVIASMVTAFQDRFEENWAGAALGNIQESTAKDISSFFHNGSVWSPEVLLYIFKMSVILCSSILLITLFFSIPNKTIKHFSNWGTIGITLVIGFAGMTFLGSSSTLKMKPILNDRFQKLKVVRPATAFDVTNKNPVDIGKRFALQGGKDIYMSNCAVCHGEQLDGLEYLGVPLIKNDYVEKSDINELSRHIREGRPLADPHNYTGRIMPGFPQFSYDETKRLVLFIQNYSLYNN